MRTTRQIVTIASTILVLVAVTAPMALATGDVNRAGCQEFRGTEESPGFQASLPDCRALEMVTPPYKGGQPAFGLRHQPAPIAPDGERLLGIDFAGFAETGNLENKGFEVGAIYSFARTANGWATEAIEPRAHENARAEYVTASTDLKSSLWELGNQAQANEEPLEPRLAGFFLSLRTEAPNAHFVPVGRLTPPSSTNGSESVIVRGASADLSHIAFETFASSSDMWPGDTTEEGRPSLYEYHGVEQQEPTLVGVRNEGTLTGSFVNEHAELISQCGTDLGSVEEGSTYGAVSRDGGLIYFTPKRCEEGAKGSGPEVTELFARTGESHTIPISEPTSAQCAACNVPATVELGRRMAVFEGAGVDGSRAFFLSEQELLPGAKGDSLYEYDWNRPAGQQIVLIAPEALGVARTSEDGSHVYFVASPALPASPDSSLAVGHQTPIAGEPNLYSYDTDSATTQFVVTLPAGDEPVWQHPDSNRPVVASHNGRFLLFKSAGQLTPDDTGAVSQLFEYDAQAEKLVRVSRGQVSAGSPGGFENDGNTLNEAEAPRLILTPQYQANEYPAASRSGASVAETGAAVFTSSDTLAPGAVRGRENVYEYREGNVYLVSAGDELAPLRAEESRLIGISESGRDIFFFTANELLPEDADTQADWYDAREGGGFPPATSSPACAGEACREPFAPSPGLPIAGGSQIAPGEAAGLDIAQNGSPPRPNPLTRAQKLTKALKACRKEPKKRRAACEKKARRLFGSRPKTNAASTHNKKGR